MKMMRLDDFLTRKEINQARTLYHATAAVPGVYAKRVCEQIIRPNIARINVHLHQANDPMYLAYAVEYVMRMTQGAR